MADKNGKKWFEEGYDQSSDPAAKKPEYKIPEATIGPASPDTKTVVSREEARKMGMKTETLPTQFELEHPIVTGSKATDEKGWIDNDGNVHLNSRATEARSKAAAEDRAQGRDYKTAKAPSSYELDLRKRNLGEKHYDGTYVHSDGDLKHIIDQYGQTDPELAKVAQAELDKRNPKPAASAQPQRSNLGGRTTDEWVKWMKSQGYSDAEIAAAYEKEGYSREGDKFKAAMAKYNEDSEGAGSGSGSGSRKAKPTTEEMLAEGEEHASKTALKEKADAIDEMTDKFQSDIDKINKYITDNTDKIDQALEKKRSLRQLRDTLPTTIIGAYKRGDFGDLSDPDEKKDAKRTMGYFILNQIQTALMQAAQGAYAAAGKSYTAPTQSAWDAYRKKLSDTGVETTFKQRQEANTAGVNLIEDQGKNYINLQGKRFDITGSAFSDALKKFQSDVDDKEYLRRMEQDSRYAETLTDKERSNIAALRYLASQEGDKNIAAQADVLASKIIYEKNKNDAGARKELISAQQAALNLKLTQSQIREKDMLIEQISTTMKLTEAQIQELKVLTNGYIIDNKYKGAEHMQKIITGYADTISKAVDAALPDNIEVF